MTTRRTLSATRETAITAWLAQVDGYARRCADQAESWATYEKASVEAEAAVCALADMRARFAADLAQDGWSMARIGSTFGITRGRAHQLVQRGNRPMSA